jgi:hypothetical protein
MLGAEDLLTMPEGIVTVDLGTSVADWAVPVPRSRRSALALADGSILALYGATVVRWHDDALAIRAHLDCVTGAWDGLAGRAGALAYADGILPQSRLEADLLTGLLQGAVEPSVMAPGVGIRVADGPGIVASEGVHTAPSLEQQVRPARGILARHMASNPSERSGLAADVDEVVAHVASTFSMPVDERQ